MRLKQLSLRKIPQAWDLFFFDPEDAMPYSFFRIGYAAIMLVNAAGMFASLEFYFGEAGPMPYEVSRKFVGPMALTIFSLLPKNDLSLYLVYWTFVASLVCLMFGVFSRFAAIVSYLLLVSFAHRNDFISDGEDSVLRIFGLMLIFMPHGKHLSVDRALSLLRGKTPIGPGDRKAWPTALRFIQVYLSFMFICACWWKLRGKAWINGTAMYYVSRLDDFFGRFPMPNFPFEVMPLTRLATWSVLVVEALAPILVWFKETRFIALMAAMTFHLLCEYSMNLFLFHWIMLLGWCTFFTDEEMRRAAQAISHFIQQFGVKPVRVLFRGESIACRRLVAVVSELDIFSLVGFEPVAAFAEAPAGPLPLRIEAVPSAVTGFSAVRHLLKSVPLAWPVLPLLHLPGFAGLADRWAATVDREQPEPLRQAG